MGTVTWLQHFAMLSPQTRDNPKLNHIHSKIPKLFSIRHQVDRKSRKNLVAYLKDNNYLTFSFVRHPFDRLVSAYREKVEKKDKGLYVKHRLQKKYGSSDFNTFLQHVINGYKNHDQIDRHWRLFESRCAYCDLRYDVIGRAETFNEDAK